MMKPRRLRPEQFMQAVVNGGIGAGGAIPDQGRR
jgi:hypothetical protein